LVCLKQTFQTNQDETEKNLRMLIVLPS